MASKFWDFGDWYSEGECVTHSDRAFRMDCFSSQMLSLSILKDTYRFTNEHLNTPTCLTSKVKSELRCAVGIITILFVPLRTPWRSEISVSDSSEFGFGICRRHVDPVIAGRIGRWGERLRYQPEDTTLARAGALGAAAVQDVLNDNQEFKDNCGFSAHRCREGTKSRQARWL
jgi:hypothetical protein